MTVRVTTVTSAVLEAKTFCGFFCVRYDVTPPNLKKQCNGYSSSFYVCHGLISRNRVLVIACHSKVRDNILYLTWQALPYNYVRSEPLIHQVRSRSEGGVSHGSGGLETRVDVLVLGLWKNLEWCHHQRLIFRRWHGYLQVWANG